MADQYTLQNPVTQYPQPPFPEQQQPGPGLASKMDPEPDHGEATYRGSGRLTGRKALITGGDSGNRPGDRESRSPARGADVAIVYLPAEESDAQEVLNLIKEAGQQALAIPGDIKNEDFCSAAVEETVTAFGGLDVLVIIAGKQQQNKDFSTITTADFDETYKTNVYAMFWLCKAALPYLPAGGSIINTASVQAYQPSPFLVDYASSKAAIKQLHQGPRGTDRGEGDPRQRVAPGPIWTPLEVSGGQPPRTSRRWAAAKLRSARPGQPAEMAPLYVFLASGESSYVSGRNSFGHRGHANSLAGHRRKFSNWDVYWCERRLYIRSRGWFQARAPQSSVKGGCHEGCSRKCSMTSG